MLVVPWLGLSRRYHISGLRCRQGRRLLRVTTSADVTSLEGCDPPALLEHQKPETKGESVTLNSLYTAEYRRCSKQRGINRVHRSWNST